MVGLLCDLGGGGRELGGGCALEAGARDRPVHILQIGDSHTAGDRITGAVRARWQARFGVGGRGVLPPGVPYAGYAPMQVEVTTTDWPLRTDVLSGGRLPVGVGFTGSEADVADGAVMTIAAENSAAFDKVQICGEGWPKDAELALTGSAGLRTMVFPGSRDEIWQPVCQTAIFDTLQTRLEIRPTGRVKLHDVRLTRQGPGVELSSLGVVGGTIQDLVLRNGDWTRLELDAWRPDLVIVAFGVNDGFAPNFNVEDYESWLNGALTQLRVSAPDPAPRRAGRLEGWNRRAVRRAGRARISGGGPGRAASRRERDGRRILGLVRTHGRRLFGGAAGDCA